MSYRQSLLGLAVAAGLSATPAANAIDLGTYNDTSFSFGGFIKAEGILEDATDQSDRVFGRINQTRFKDTLINSRLQR